MDRATREEEREDITMKKMKALGKMCIVVSVFIGLLFAAVCTEHTYSKDAIVVDIIGHNYVIVEDVDGYLWEVYADDLHIGEEVVVVLDDKHTAEIYDDMIIDIY
jgi:hypothetical protein